MKEYFFYILFNLIYIINLTPISIPLETFKTIMEPDSNNDYPESQSFILELFNSNIASNIKIGSQSYPLKSFYNINNPYFYISKNCFIEDISSFNYKTNFNYNRFKSESFYNTSLFDLSFATSSKACTALENFEFSFYKKSDIIKIEKINFILSEDTNENMPNCMQIGLIENQYKESSFKEINLITQLKKNNYIKEYLWCIIFNMPMKYNNNYLLIDPDELLNLKGNIILGDYPHIFDSQNFFESQLTKTYSFFSEYTMKWELKFNKIFFKNNNNNRDEKINDNNAYLDPSNYLIYSPKEYFELIIENYFQKYIDEDNCYLYYFDEYISINCDKSEKFSINEIKKFPSIFFEHINLDYTFELSYKDLFVEKNNVYWFLIVSDSMFYTSDWTLGNIFMRKYQFIFNLDTKEIGFYNPKLEKSNKNNENNENNENKNIKKENNAYKITNIILILILIFILAGIGIFIRMKFYTKNAKKKRANELDDDYEYVSDKKINVKNNESENINNNDNKLYNYGNNIN